MLPFLNPIISPKKSLSKYPNNFDLCTINIEDESVVIGDIPSGMDSTDCMMEQDLNRRQQQYHQIIIIMNNDMIIII